MRESFLLTHGVIEEATANARSIMEKNAGAIIPFTDKDHFHIIVMDPAQPYDPNKCFKDAIIYERSYNCGDPKHNKLVHSKAKTARRCQMTTSDIIKHCPDQLKEGDATCPGGVYYEGLVVAVSSDNPELDELFAHKIIEQCRIILRSQVDTIQESTIEYLGDKTVLIIYDHYMAHDPSLWEAVHAKSGSVIASLGYKLEILPSTEEADGTGPTPGSIGKCEMKFHRLIERNIVNNVLIMITPHMFGNSSGLITLISRIMERYFDQDGEDWAFLLTPVLSHDNNVTDVIPQDFFTKIDGEYPRFKRLCELSPINLKQDDWEQKLQAILSSHL